MSGGHDKWWVYRGNKPIALLLLAAVCMGGLYTEGAALLGSRTLDARELGTAPIGRYVHVACDSVERAGRFDNGRQAYLCKLGGRTLPVVGERSDDEANRSHFSGRLREFRDKDRYGRSDTGDVDFIWPDDVLRSPDLVNAYLEEKTLWEGRVVSALAILVGLATVALSFRWGIGPWGRRWNRRRQR